MHTTVVGLTERSTKVKIRSDKLLHLGSMLFACAKPDFQMA